MAKKGESSTRFGNRFNAPFGLLAPLQKKHHTWGAARAFASLLAVKHLQDCEASYCPLIADLCKDVNLNPILMDTQGNANGALAAAQAVVDKNENVTALVGPSSSSASKVVSEFAKKHNPMISVILYAATDPELSSKEKHPSVFRLVPSDTTTARAMIAFVKEFDWKEIYGVFARDASYAEGMQKYIQKHVVHTMSFWTRTYSLKGSLDFDEVAQFAKKVRARVLILVGAKDLDTWHLFHRFYTDGLMTHSVVLSGDLVAGGSPLRSVEAGLNPNSIFKGTISFKGATENKLVADWSQLMKSRTWHDIGLAIGNHSFGFGPEVLKSPPSYAAHAYDATIFLAAGLHQQFLGRTPRLVDALKLSMQKGGVCATGSVWLDRHHDRKLDFFVYQYQGSSTPETIGKFRVDAGLRMFENKRMCCLPSTTSAPTTTEAASLEDSGISTVQIVVIVAAAVVVVTCICCLLAFHRIKFLVDVLFSMGKLVTVPAKPLAKAIGRAEQEVALKQLFSDLGKLEKHATGPERRRQLVAELQSFCEHYENVCLALEVLRGLNTSINARAADGPRDREQPAVTCCGIVFKAKQNAVGAVGADARGVYATMRQIAQHCEGTLAGEALDILVQRFVQSSSDQTRDSQQRLEVLNCFGKCMFVPMDGSIMLRRRDEEGEVLAKAAKALRDIKDSTEWSAEDRLSAQRYCLHFILAENAIPDSADSRKMLDNLIGTYADLGGNGGQQSAIYNHQARTQLLEEVMNRLPGRESQPSATCITLVTGFAQSMCRLREGGISPPLDDIRQLFEMHCEALSREYPHDPFVSTFLSLGSALVSSGVLYPPRMVECLKIILRRSPSRASTPETRASTPETSRTISRSCSPLAPQEVRRDYVLQWIADNYFLVERVRGCEQFPDIIKMLCFVILKTDGISTHECDWLFMEFEKLHTMSTGGCLGSTSHAHVVMALTRLIESGSPRMSEERAYYYVDVFVDKAWTHHMSWSYFQMRKGKEEVVKGMLNLMTKNLGEAVFRNAWQEYQDVVLGSDTSL